METIQIGIDDLLAIIERSARQVATVAADPRGLDPQALLRHIARQYAVAEKLAEQWAAAQAAGTDKTNGEAAAPN